jgi:RHS repeat-associated protein
MYLIFAIKFIYDFAFNNILNVNINDGDNIAIYQYNNPNNPTELTSYEGGEKSSEIKFNYDLDGNMLNDEKGNTLTYDSLDDLVKVKSSVYGIINYAYNALGEQMAQWKDSRTTSTEYEYVYPNNLGSYISGTKVLGPDGNIYVCKDRVEAWCNEKQYDPTWIYGDGAWNKVENPLSNEPMYTYYMETKALDQYQGGNTKHYSDGATLVNGSDWEFLIQDKNNNVISTISNDQQDERLFLTYLPFGYQSNVFGDTSKNNDNTLDINKLSKGYNGILTDRITKNKFLGDGYRSYNPVLRRFMKYDSSSPIGLGGINGYSYVGNNPIMAYDPTGHMSSVGAGILAMAIAVVMTAGTAAIAAVPAAAVLLS